MFWGVNKDPQGPSPTPSPQPAGPTKPGHVGVRQLRPGRGEPGPAPRPGRELGHRLSRGQAIDAGPVCRRERPVNPPQFAQLPICPGEPFAVAGVLRLIFTCFATLLLRQRALTRPASA